MNRHLSRVIIMQTLYEWDFRPKANLESIKQRNIDNYKEDADEEFINISITNVLGNLKVIDEYIVKSAPEWPIEQISAIDKTILRVAIAEIIYSQDIPPKVAINEAVELGKTFGGQNSSKFINGVLGTVYRQSPNYNPKDDEPKIKEEDKEDDTNKK